MEFGITEEELLEDKVEFRIKAYFPPKAPTYAYQVYAFIRQNDKHILVAGGMAHVTLGLDKYKLSQLAPFYNLEYDRILPFINLYETEILKRQQRLQKDTA